MKFGILDDQGNVVPYDYGNRYFRQPCGKTERLVIGASHSNIKLLDKLASLFPTPRYQVIYVLLFSSFDDQANGRYLSPIIEGHEDLQMFIWTFQNFFEGDGRHHLWIAAADSGDFLVYDHHDVIFAYGDLAAVERTLAEAGFTNAEFWFPAPHHHSFPPANADTEEAVRNYFDWKRSELLATDESY